MTELVIVCIIGIGMCAIFWTWKQRWAQEASDTYAQSLGAEIVEMAAEAAFPAGWGFDWKDANDHERAVALAEMRKVLAIVVPLVEDNMIEVTIQEACDRLAEAGGKAITIERAHRVLRKIIKDGVPL